MNYDHMEVGGRVKQESEPRTNIGHIRVDSMDGIGRVESGTETEKMSGTNLPDRIEEAKAEFTKVVNDELMTHILFRPSLTSTLWASLRLFKFAPGKFVCRIVPSYINLLKVLRLMQDKAKKLA